MNKKIARWCIEQAIKNSESGSWCVYFDEIEEKFGAFDVEAVGNEIENAEEVADLEVSDCFDFVLWLMYLDNYQEEETA